MLPFHMLAALPVQPSPRLALLRDLCALCVKIPTKPHRRISPCLATAQSLPSFSTPSKHRARTNARNPFPLYRLLHNFRTTPGVGPSTHSLACHFLSMPCPTPAHALSITPLNATLTKKRGPPRLLAPPFLAIHYSPPTTHFPQQSATLSLRGTHDPR